MNKKKLRKYTGVTTEVQVNKLAMRAEETGTTHGEETGNYTWGGFALGGNPRANGNNRRGPKQNVNITDTDSFFLKEKGDLTLSIVS